MSRADVVTGRDRIKFVRRPFEGINIYTRRRGETKWRFLSRATKSPFTDPTPLATANAAERREYGELCVGKDVELGPPSKVVVIPVRD